MIKAEYHPHLDPNLNDNPLSETIQVELFEESFLKKLTVITNIVPNFWELPEIYQLTQLRQLTDVYIPDPQAWRIHNKIMSLLLFCYVHRNPFSKTMQILMRKISHSLKHQEMFDGQVAGMSTAPACLVYGESGTGKTTTIRKVLGTIPQAIEHTSYKGEHFKKLQLVWVSFDLPANGSPKAMCANFFRAVDKALGTSYHDIWIGQNDKKYSVDSLMAAMQSIAANHYLGVVHVDELQFMLGYGKIKGSPNLQTLETLFNKIGVPIIQSSTQIGVELFDTLKESDHRLGHDMSTVRRMLNDRQFKFVLHPKNSVHFNNLFDALFPQELLLNNDESNREQFKGKFHELSVSLPAIMVRLALLHHETLKALINKPGQSEKYRSTFDIILLERVYQNQFHLIDSALSALRKGNRKLFEQKIRANNSKKAVYSNEEAKEAKKADKTNEAKLPQVKKSDDTPHSDVKLVDFNLLAQEICTGVGGDE